MKRGKAEDRNRWSMSERRGGEGGEGIGGGGGGREGGRGGGREMKIPPFSHRINYLLSCAKSFFKSVLRHAKCENAPVMTYIRLAVTTYSMTQTMRLKV